ncbi:hypothetical protein ACH4PU_32755 [Streptomyces sp. NPDC021100]|uniref:hypothetical protein n=1 Tax=Streptomyces sp. NPDC021100 TaxID=3365114 RepID=UPI0037897722
MDDAALDLDGHPAGLSTSEYQLAGVYTQAMSIISRCVLALESGDLRNLSEKAADLALAARELGEAAERAAANGARPSSVLAAVTARGWQNRAVQQLHPGPYGPGVENR